MKIDVMFTPDESEQLRKLLGVTEGVVTAKMILNAIAKSEPVAASRNPIMADVQRRRRIAGL